MTYTLKVFGITVLTLTSQDTPLRPALFDVVLDKAPGGPTRDVVLVVAAIKALRQAIPGLPLKTAKDFVNGCRVGQRPVIARALPDQKAQDLRDTLFANGMAVCLVPVSS